MLPNEKPAASWIADLSDCHLLAAHRIAKTRLRAFFGAARPMKALRDEIERRGMTPGYGRVGKAS